MSRLLDTNVWLYAFLESQDAGKRERALAVIEESNPSLSVQIVNEICANLLRKAKLPEDQLRAIIEALYERYTVFALDGPTMLVASELRSEYRFSFWDSLIVATAWRNGVDEILSEDMNDGLIVRGAVKITNPFREVR